MLQHVAVALESSHISGISTGPLSFHVFAVEQLILNYKYSLVMITMKQSELLMDDILSGPIMLCSQRHTWHFVLLWMFTGFPESLMDCMDQLRKVLLCAALQSQKMPITAVF